MPPRTPQNDKVQVPKGDPSQVPKNYPFLPSVTENFGNTTQNADSATPSIPAAYRAGAKPRRRSAAKMAPKMSVIQREPGLDVFPAMTDEQIPPEELLMMLMRLLNTA